jgi:hypothetical protein
VSLFSDSICFGEPRTEIVIHVARLRQSKSVDVISRRESLNRPKTWMLEPPRQNDMPINPAPSWRNLGKRNSHVKCDASLLRQHDHRAESIHGCEHRIEQCAYAGRLPSKVALEVMQSAGVRLISVGESPLASQTPP